MQFRQEYPRPQFERKNYQLLNGEWDFQFDDEAMSLKEKWYNKDLPLDQQINVPFCYESKLSQINLQEPHNQVFYKKVITIPKAWQGQNIILNFEAVDYHAQVFVNGYKAGEHTGGHIGFSLDITDYLTYEEETIAVYVEDIYDDEAQPRGKQFWEKESAGIWYTRTTGIWQSVWLEPVDACHIQQVKWTPDIDQGTVKMALELAQVEQMCEVEVTISFEGEIVVTDIIQVYQKQVVRTFDVIKQKIFHTNAHGGGRYWSPENPKLFDVSLKLKKDQVVKDEITTYFGMRKIHTENGITYLNNRPYYFRLVLDQGYWPEGLLTAPSDEDFKYDIQLSKEMGFNGCRKHQKVEDQRFLYWADHMGFLVWGEMAASCVYTDKAVVRLMQEWTEIIQRDYNHPCIVAWVPLNESWGVSEIAYNQMQQSHSLALYHMIKSLDATRLVVNNDGWEMTQTDICAIHNYTHGALGDQTQYEIFKKVIHSKELMLTYPSADRKIYCPGFAYQGEPILLTEFGGIAYDVANSGGWGYSQVNEEADYVSELDRVFETVISSPIIYGFCYTQLTDVEQEINGLLTYDRQPKADLNKIRACISKWRPSGLLV